MTDQTRIKYTRTRPCPACARARALLTENSVPFREVMIDLDPEARSYVEKLTGFRAVPTLVVSPPNLGQPQVEAKPLEQGRSPRGVDRGPVITEPDMIGLRRWLAKHGFLAA